MELEIDEFPAVILQARRLEQPPVVLVDVGAKPRVRQDALAGRRPESNFAERAKVSFCTETAMEWIKNGDPERRRKAAEYVSRAPAFVKTDLRDKLQAEAWFRRDLE